MEKNLIPQPNFQRLLKKVKAAKDKKEGEKFLLHEIQHEFDLNENQAKSLCYRMRTFCEDKIICNLSRIWSQTKEGKKCTSGIELVPKNRKGRAVFAGDVDEDLKQLEGRKRRLEKRLKSAQETKALKSKEIKELLSNHNEDKKYILLSDSRK